MRNILVHRPLGHDTSIIVGNNGDLIASCKVHCLLNAVARKLRFINVSSCAAIEDMSAIVGKNIASYLVQRQSCRHMTDAKRRAAADKCDRCTFLNRPMQYIDGMGRNFFLIICQRSIQIQCNKLIHLPLLFLVLQSQRFQFFSTRSRGTLRVPLP